MRTFTHPVDERAGGSPAATECVWIGTRWRGRGNAASVSPFGQLSDFAGRQVVQAIGCRPCR